MSDISFAEDAYQRSIDRITALEKDVASWRTNTSSTQNAQRDERARLKARIEGLTEERDAQQNLVEVVNKRRLKMESSKWFGSSECNILKAGIS
jgi:THO complex subunit 2